MKKDKEAYCMVSIKLSYNTWGMYLERGGSIRTIIESYVHPYRTNMCERLQVCFAYLHYTVPANSRTRKHVQGYPSVS